MKPAIFLDRDGTIIKDNGYIAKMTKVTKKRKKNLDIIIDNNMGEDHILLELKKILPEII